ncbi:hypothetical protein T02_8845 [Trichinella nativa]|uniref:Uncharacterized protein n=1 Tax=Trichinella nativa TaxID=6335 RepID=A0A0V1KNG5_9BILA|nr:hypothetical protein T02_8845 [Trichinella nativa]
MAEWAEYRKGFRGITVRARSLISAGKLEAAGSQNTKAIEGEKNVRLPFLELPTFRVASLHFGDSGTGLLTASTRITGLSSSNADYECVAVQRVKERFDRPYIADDVWRSKKQRQYGFDKSKRDAYGKTDMGSLSREELKDFCPFLNERGILKVEGRLCRANLLVETKHPMLHPHAMNAASDQRLLLVLCENCRSAAGDRESGTLMAGQLEAAEQIRVRIAQRQCFRGEIDALRTNGCVGAQSRLRQLRPLCLKIRQSQRLRLRTLSWISPSPQPIREADEEGHITQVCVSNQICAVHLELVPEISTTDNFRSFQSDASEQHRPGLSGTALDLNCCHQARFQAAGAGASTHQ